MKLSIPSKERAYKKVVSWAGLNGRQGLQVGKRMVGWQPEVGPKL